MVGSNNRRIKTINFLTNEVVPLLKNTLNSQEA